MEGEGAGVRASGRTKIHNKSQLTHGRTDCRLHQKNKKTYHDRCTVSRVSMALLVQSEKSGAVSWSRLVGLSDVPLFWFRPSRSKRPLCDGVLIWDSQKRRKNNLIHPGEGCNNKRCFLFLSPRFFFFFFKSYKVFVSYFRARGVCLNACIQRHCCENWIGASVVEDLIQMYVKVIL